MRRTELGRGTRGLTRGQGLGRGSKQMARGKGVNPVSAKGKVRAAAYRDTRMAVAVRSGGRCELAPLIPEVGCDGPMACCHIEHRGKNRAAGTDPDNCLAGCQQHHSFVHAHPTLARERGLMI